MTTNIGPHLLGRTVEHDPASRNYPTPVRRATRARNVIWTNNAPILDQGELGSCVGNTVVEWLNCSVAVHNRIRGQHSRRYLTETDAVRLYSDATRRDDDTAEAYPPTDCGTSGLGAAKAMQAEKFIDGYTWTFSFPAFLGALALSPVCVGIPWYGGMFDPDKAGYVTPTGTVEGGHEILARGVDYGLGRVLFRNHWTKDWGVKGECWMTFPVIERLLNEEGDVMVPTVIRA